MKMSILAKSSKSGFAAVKLCYVWSPLIKSRGEPISLEPLMFENAEYEK